MDIFNKKKVEELEEKLRVLEGVRSENERLRKELDNATEDLQELLTLKDNIPADCTPGTYCSVCEFGKAYVYHYYTGGRSIYTSYDHLVRGYICNKANSCKNFIQKEIKE